MCRSVSPQVLQQREADAINRKIRLQWLVNLLMSLFFAFAVLLAVEQLLIKDASWYSYLLKSWPIIICFLLGMAGRNNKILKLILLPISVIGACILIAFQLPWNTSFDVVYLAALLATALLLYIMGTRCSETFPSMLTVTTVIIFLAELLIFDSSAAGVLMPLNICAIASFFIGLFNFNSNNLKAGVHNAKGGTSMPIPAGLRGKNILLLTGFLTVALLISNFAPIGAPLKTFFSFIIKGILKIFLFLGSTTLDVSPDASPTPEATSSTDMVLPDVPVNPYAHIIVIIFLSSIILIFLLGIILMMKERKDGKGSFWSAFKKRLKKNDIGQLDLDFEEDIERINSLKDLFKKRRRDMSSFFERLFKRQERFEDMPDNRMKVRFSYKMLLKKSEITKRGSTSTPLEISKRFSKDSISQLARDYSEAKYNDIEPVSFDAAQNARSALTDINRSKVKNDDGVS